MASQPKSIPEDVIKDGAVATFSSLSSEKTSSDGGSGSETKGSSHNTEKQAREKRVGFAFRRGSSSDEYSEMSSSSSHKAGGDSKKVGNDDCHEWSRQTIEEQKQPPTYPVSEESSSQATLSSGPKNKAASEGSLEEKGKSSHAGDKTPYDMEEAFPSKIPRSEGDNESAEHHKQRKKDKEATDDAEDDETDATPTEIRAKKSKKRENNRISAAKSRRKRKTTLADLQKNVDTASLHYAELQKVHELLRAQVEALFNQNFSLILGNTSSQPAPKSFTPLNPAQDQLLQLLQQAIAHPKHEEQAGVPSSGLELLQQAFMQQGRPMQQASMQPMATMPSTNSSSSPQVDLNQIELLLQLLQAKPPRPNQTG